MSEQFGLHDQPGHLIRRAHQIAVAVFLDTLRGEVTPVQYAVLMAVAEKPGIDQATLAQEAALDTSSTADIAARLEAKGWILRHVLARGRRSLELTPAGAQLLAGLEPGIARLQHALLDGLSPREQADFMRLLRKFVNLNNERSRAPLQRGVA
jgi:MarR family transcriptional regulator, temperature-dependent positive regulator of motility